MKSLFLSVIVVFITLNFGFAQRKLSHSATMGAYTYIYKLTDRETYEIASKSKSVINDDFFHTLLDSVSNYKLPQAEKKMAFGNYLHVKAMKNKLVYQVVPVYNVNLQFINNRKDFQFIVYDSKGSLIDQAVVTIDKGKTAKYDHLRQLYHAGHQGRKGVITIKHEGINNYFNYNIEENYRYRNPFFRKLVHRSPIKYTWMPLRKLFNPDGDYDEDDEDEKPDYQGYMVFNKPKFKPLDTLKFKAYLLDRKGRDLHDKQLKVEIGTSTSATDKKLITMLKPYRAGGYEYSFALSDSLDLKLDNDYTISLWEKKGKDWTYVYSKDFRYEDYELKAINFSVRTDQKEHRPGRPVTAFIKASDENDLAVPDGRVEVTALTQSVIRYRDKQVFVKDSLWKTNIVLDPVGETKLVLPDSIFPQADLNFSLNFAFLNSNNESRKSAVELKYFREKKELKPEFKGDSLYLNYLIDGKPVAQKAMLHTTYKSYYKQDSSYIQLPAAFKINPLATAYHLKTTDGFKERLTMGQFAAGINISAFQSKDSLKLSVANEHLIPFWYTVFSGNEVLLRGYAVRLDTMVKHTHLKAGHIRLNYLWGGEEKSMENSAFYTPGQLNVKLLTPDVVYPGQNLSMQVKVTDELGLPVRSTDLTAYAYTSKFKNSQDFSLPDYGKRFFARKLKASFETEDISADGDLKLNWEKWGKELGLDTIQYYKFSQTKGVYTIAEDGVDGMTLIAPFAVKGGEIEPVNIIYVDGVPVYFSQADQVQRYAFKLSPGKHNLKLRTASHLITLNGYDFQKGKKTILSINAEESNQQAKVVPAAVNLTEAETLQLAQYMIRVADNFSGQKTIISSEDRAVLLNNPSSVQGKEHLLTGPFHENFLSFESGSTAHNFLKEWGYTYTFLPGLIKQQSYESDYTKLLGSLAELSKWKKNQSYLYGLKRMLNDKAEGENDNYRQFPTNKKEIDSLWDDYLNLRSRTTTLFNNSSSENPEKGALEMVLETSFEAELPYVKNIIISRYDQADFLQIYRGNTSYFSALEQGKYRIMYLLKDNSYFVAEQVTIRKGGKNFFEWKGMKVVPADKMSIQIDQELKSIGAADGQNRRLLTENRINEQINYKFFDPSGLIYEMWGKVVEADGVTGIPAVWVNIKGLNYGTTTAVDGTFRIKVPVRGGLLFSFIGYMTKEVPIQQGNVGSVMLEEDQHSLNEVVVTGYGSVHRNNSTAAIYSLSGRVAGVYIGKNAGASAKVMIRGYNSLAADKKPLVIVDGLPFSGDLSSVDPLLIEDMNILKDAEAMAIYGNRAANGVIIIRTKGGNKGLNKDVEGTLPQGPDLRSKFSDYAIWQPRLVTDEEGKASFKVKFPDDITSWTTRVIALNGRRQGGQTETNIRSFKILSANFVSPQFALIGDSIRVIGKLMNYGNTEEEANRTFKFNDVVLLKSNVKFKNAKIDTMSIVAKGADSLKFEYVMQQENGYSDGELRKIPLLSRGVLETKGYFNALNKDTSITYLFDEALGKVSLRAEASVFPTLLDEMDRLRRYEYLCNEQLASKLKALLMEKTVRKYLGEGFKEEKNIKELLRKLAQNRRKEGTWGWWKNSDEEFWISLHVVEALLQAQKQGYEVELDKNRLSSYLSNKMSNTKNFDQVYGLKLLLLMDDKYELKGWINAIEEQYRGQLKATGWKQPLYEQLQLMLLKQKAGINVDLNWLLNLKKETMFGSIYWGDQSNRFWDNSIQNTLLAYQLLKADGHYKNELERIHRYFLEQRKDGQWRNTYESSLILEAILPELMVEGKKPEPASIMLNGGEKISVFPFNQVLSTKKLSLEKKGAAPVYFTAYQQFNNPEPEKVSKDFSVKTWFDQKGSTVSKLKAGIPTTLKVEVEVRADADYVMIEIPVPAGCSYENKLQSFWGVETHREYFKHKTSIFCTKLKQGKYTFNIELMPRYSGNYSLNPAKAEMMYFPVFYGREGMKRIVIK